ncbi:ABC-2 family transporter protein [Fontisphaera persica]|uniref:ABC transporter permease n=1 Tax=Fontisphaera persica TaxID=2974023 RepID=UPI0024BFDB5A|nr:ABC-2 family transporter protein [Fontisphaera persica]WCJ58559.1 ABC-2 family transporter protein [Fontisphaera persica]
MADGLPMPKVTWLQRLARYAALYAAMWRNSLIREMGFKTNFLLWIVVELLWFALQITFFLVLYTHTEAIGTWTRWQVVMLVGASHFIQQVFTALFLNNCVQLSEHVRTGRLDFLLLLPVNTRFVVSLRHVDLGSFVNAATAVVVMGYAARQLGLSPTVAELAGFGVLLVAGILIHYSLMYMLACISFWTVRAQGIVWSYYNLFNLARFPDEAFRGLFKVAFTYALPVLLVVNVPVKMLVDKLRSPWELLLLLGMSLLLLWISEKFWRLSLRHYTSASA